MFGFYSASEIKIWGQRLNPPETINEGDSSD